MEHSEFLAKVKESWFLWGVKGFYQPVAKVWGSRGLLTVVMIATAILLPSVGVAAYAILTHKYFSLFWLVPGMLAFLTGHPGLNCIEGTMYLVVAAIGLVLTFVFGPHHAVGGVIPGITWGAMGALKGTTMACMEDELKKSKELYERLRDDGTLILRGA